MYCRCEYAYICIMYIYICYVYICILYTCMSIYIYICVCVFNDGMANMSDLVPGGWRCSKIATSCILGIPSQRQRGQGGHTANWTVAETAVYRANQPVGYSVIQPECTARTSDLQVVSDSQLHAPICKLLWDRSERRQLQIVVDHLGSLKHLKPVGNDDVLEWKPISAVAERAVYQKVG